MNIADALWVDAGLADVQWVLIEPPALDAIRDLLNTLLDPAFAIGDCTLQRAKYKPGRYLTTYYAAQILSHHTAAAGTRLAEVTWMPPGSADPRGSMPEILGMEAEAIERGLAAPFRKLAGEAPEWGMRVQVAPLDARFPRLTRLSDQAYVRALLASVAEVQPAADSYTITPIRYRPGQRHVLRYQPADAAGQVDAGRTLFAKIYNDDKGARTFELASRISDWMAAQRTGLSAIKPLAYVADEGLVLYPLIVGTPLSELLRTPGAPIAQHLRSAGAALRLLHRTPETLVELQPHSFAKEVKSVASASEYVHPLLPAAGARITTLLERARALYERLPQEPPSFAYGDFKADHLWVTAAGLTLIDLDTCYLSDPAIDLGKFLADILFWYDGYGLTSAEEAQAQFLAGYGADVSPDRLLRARLFEALVLIKSTVRRVKLFDPGWADRTARLIDRAGAVLAQLEESLV